MTTPAEYARSYAQLSSWFWNGDDWVARRTPIVNYLQHNGSRQDRRAASAQQALRALLPRATGISNVNHLPTFNFNDYDYINHSIDRCFIGKACPWEIQETLQLLSEIGGVAEGGLVDYCNSSLGVDCGGFVANYWGEGCPHMVNPSPAGWGGILPRYFWANSSQWSSAVARRRRSASAVSAGDAAIFFKDVKDNNPDIMKQRDSHGVFIQGTGSEAFHIGLVSNVGFSGDDFTSLEIADSSGASSIYGGSGVNVRSIQTIVESGKSGNWVYCKSGANEWIYFVEPPGGWGPESAYNIS
ncbi:MAG TPA: hypothetical protein VMT68_17045 [Caulobacteraceae bacterium]|nr:hypothetical protein [Caulobacteraceae bacterium]